MLYDFFTFLSIPLCLTIYYYNFDKTKKIKINDKPEIYLVTSFKNMNLWYTYQDFIDFKNDFYNDKENIY